MLRKFCTAVLVIGVAGCQTYDPHTGQQQTNQAGTGALIGTATGALLGAAINHDNRGKGALVGAAVGAAAGGGIGYYRDQQQKKLSQQLANSGVQVQAQGDNLKLIMPGNITFQTNSAQIQPAFYSTLNQVAASLNEFPNSMVRVTGHTDSTGTDSVNIPLSQNRAQAVAQYLTSQGVAYNRLQTAGMGSAYPIASNSNDAGRQQNRRVELEVIYTGQ